MRARQGSREGAGSGILQLVQRFRGQGNQLGVERSGCGAFVRAPSGLILTRQNVPVLAGTSTEGVARGGYVLAGSPADADVLLIATGSEVSLALGARDALAADGVSAAVISMPCVEWFDAQPQEYRDSVLPPSVRARVSVEAGIAMPWYRFVGDAGEIVSIEHYGASASDAVLFEKFGFTVEAVTAAANRSIDSAR